MFPDFFPIIVLVAFFYVIVVIVSTELILIMAWPARHPLSRIEIYFVFLIGFVLFTPSFIMTYNRSRNRQR